MAIVPCSIPILYLYAEHPTGSSLDHDVEPDTFAAMLKGQLPNGASLGTTRHGRTEHKLGWDLTFSAPKSVSVMGLATGDRRLLDAHDRAVAAALDFAERHAATTRIREGEAVADVAEAFVEVGQEFRAGDRVQFTRNNYRAGRLNGHVAEVMGVDAQGASLWVQMEGGKRQMLDLRHLTDRHIRPGWVRTIHSSQGATCERVMAHLESFRANTVDAASAYVAISRARMGATVYTDSRVDLTEALGLREGGQVGALDETLTRHGPGANLSPDVTL